MSEILKQPETQPIEQLAQGSAAKTLLQLAVAQSTGLAKFKNCDLFIIMTFKVTK